ncbi:MAG TPA: hypothetical protein VEF71_10915 [Streptosporangiaceae bacterium]|nr:hypothetical protein [Streptosporangiaceae bacterium]
MIVAAANAQDWRLPDNGPARSRARLPAIPTDLAYGRLLLLGPGALAGPMFITGALEGSIAASSRGHQVIAVLARAAEQHFALGSTP